MDNTSIADFDLEENSTIYLSFWTCYFLDSKDGNYPTLEPGLVLNCPLQGKYLASPYYGRVLTLSISFLIYVIGVFGCIANILNIVLLRKSMNGTGISLKLLLVTLAGFEFLTSLFATGCTFAIMLFMENISRHLIVVECLRTFDSGTLLFRSGSVFLTILLSVERYVVITFPGKAGSCLSPRKSKFYIFLTLSLPMALCLPWIVSQTVTANQYAELSPNTSISDFPYIIESTEFVGKTYIPKLMIPFLIFNLGLPIPLLLIFNGLLYHSIRKWNKKHASLSSHQRKELKAAKMMASLAGFMLASNVPFVLSSFVAIFEAASHTFHREIIMLQLLGVVICASINFFVYYRFVKEFRREVQVHSHAFLDKVRFCTGKSQRTESDMAHYEMRKASYKYAIDEQHTDLLTL